MGSLARRQPVARPARLVWVNAGAYRKIPGAPRVTPGRDHGGMARRERHPDYAWPARRPAAPAARVTS